MIALQLKIKSSSNRLNLDGIMILLRQIKDCLATKNSDLIKKVLLMLL